MSGFPLAPENQTKVLCEQVNTEANTPSENLSPRPPRRISPNKVPNITGSKNPGYRPNLSNKRS